MCPFGVTGRSPGRARTLGAAALVLLAPLGALAAALLIAGCGGGGGGGSNASPVIQGIIATPTAVVPGGQVLLHANASDPDGDALSYTWYVPGGQGLFPSGSSGADVAWTAPQSNDVVAIAVTVNDGHHRVSATVNVEVSEDAPVPVFTPSSLIFGAGGVDTSETGAPPVPTESLAVVVTNLGRTTLRWTLQSDVPWLLTSPAAGTTDHERDTVMVRVDRSSLSAGDWASRIHLIWQSGTLDLPVTVWSPPQAALIVSPSVVDLGTGTGPVSLVLTNGGVGTLNWSCHPAAADTSWIGLAPADTAGSLGPRASDTLSVTRIGTGGHAPGDTLRGSLWVESNGGPATVAVTSILP